MPAVSLHTTQMKRSGLPVYQIYSLQGCQWPAAAAKSLQSCPTLCDPIDGSPPGPPVPGILQARTLEWVAVASSNACKWKVKVKLLSRVRLFETPWTAAYQAPLSPGFSRQEDLHVVKVYSSLLQTLSSFESLVFFSPHPSPLIAPPSLFNYKCSHVPGFSPEAPVSRPQSLSYVISPNPVTLYICVNHPSKRRNYLFITACFHLDFKQTSYTILLKLCFSSPNMLLLTLFSILVNIFRVPQVRNLGIIFDSYSFLSLIFNQIAILPFYFQNIFWIHSLRNTSTITSMPTECGHVDCSVDKGI